MQDSNYRRPYMRLWIDDVRGSCVVMSAAQFGAHMRMLMHAWERGGVPADERKLRRIVGEIDWEEMGDVLERWADAGDGTLQHERLERERAKMIEEQQRKARAGRSGGQARGKQNPSRTQADGQAETKHSHTPILPDSHTPTLPDDQTPILSSDGDAAPSKRRKKRITDDPFRWTEDDGWTGVTDEDHAKWAELYPAVDSRYELKRLDRWLRDNPTKAHKSHWRRWVNKLFGIKQDKGGSAGGGKVEPNTAPRRHEPDRSHIPEDCAPGQDHLFWDGTFPNIPSTYTDTAGNLRHTRTRKIICAAEA
jgi:uncharacterized protein YdaU (DUF1376 family)